MQRRRFITLALLLGVGIPVRADATRVWSARRAWEALQADDIRLIDIRSREEWQQTGIASGAWPISLHEDEFGKRLMEAIRLAGDRQVALICATGGRTFYVSGELWRMGYDRFVDVSEGMFGSPGGRGWVAENLPVESLAAALGKLPTSLKNRFDQAR